jgi:hypothetical protein
MLDAIKSEARTFPVNWNLAIITDKSKLTDLKRHEKKEDDSSLRS